MSVKVNGTIAKEIALYFIQQTSGRATSHIIKKTISQTKSILKAGYTKEEIVKVIDYVIDVRGVNLYSIGYISTAIESTLREIEEKEREEHVKSEQQKARDELASEYESRRKEVKSDDESARRNEQKVKRFGFQSRFRKKHSFDLFE